MIRLLLYQGENFLQLFHRYYLHRTNFRADLISRGLKNRISRGFNFANLVICEFSRGFIFANLIISEFSRGFIFAKEQLPKIKYLLESPYIALQHANNNKNEVLLISFTYYLPVLLFYQQFLIYICKGWIKTRRKNFIEIFREDLFSRIDIFKKISRGFIFAN